MPDSAVWDHQSFVDHPSWIDAHSSAWDSHLHNPPDAITTTEDRGNINANIGSGTIQTTKRNMSTILSTRGLGVQTEQGSDVISSQITLEETQNHTSTISSVTNGTTTDVYSITEPYDMPNVGAARIPLPPQGYFDQHRVFLLSIIAVAIILLIVAVSFLVVVLRRRSRKKNRELDTAKSTEAPTTRGGRRLVKMESQEHTYEEVELHKKNCVTGVDDTLDIRPPTTPVNGGTNELNESNGQPTTPVYSMPIMKRKDETISPAKTEIAAKNSLHRLYSEPCQFTKKEGNDHKAQENVRYSTPAPTYFIVDPSQDPHENRAGATLPRGKLVRQCDVTIEKYDKLDRTLNMTSSTPTTSNHGDSAHNASSLRNTRMVNTRGLVVDFSTGPYNQLNLDQAKSSSASPVDHEPADEKRASGLFEAKGYNTLAF